MVRGEPILKRVIARREAVTTGRGKDMAGDIVEAMEEVAVNDIIIKEGTMVTTVMAEGNIGAAEVVTGTRVVAAKDGTMKDTAEISGQTLSAVEDTDRRVVTPTMVILIMMQATTTTEGQERRIATSGRKGSWALRRTMSETLKTSEKEKLVSHVVRPVAVPDLSIVLLQGSAQPENSM